MSHEIKADYKQMLMFPPCVEDWVPCNHPARFIREIVSAMDLKALGFKISEGEDGRPHYAEEMLLKIWLYGYYNKIKSVRELEKACMENLSFIWLTGNNTPDHNTLWRFYRDNKKAIRKVFKQSVKVAMNSSLVGMVIHALDGTKIKSAASSRKMLSKKSLEKALKQLDQRIEEIEKGVETAIKEQGETGWAMPEELSDAKTLRETVMRGLEILNGQGVNNLSVVDTQARVMKTSEGNKLGYNAQAISDNKSGLIIAIDVVNEENDSHQLLPMLEETKATLDGHTAEDTLADGGYSNGEQIAAARDAEYEFILPMEAEKGGEFHTSKFKHNEEKNKVICPMGQELKFERIKESKNGKYEIRVYRCVCGSECKRSSECTRDKNGRSIDIAPWDKQVHAQIEKQKDKDKRCKLKRRGETIEVVFAGIKQGFGFRRFTVHGLENVKTQWALVCTAFNFKKLYKLWLSGELKIALKRA